MNPLLHWLTSPEWAHVVAALLHSLWQGALLAAGLALVLRRLTQPAARYRCALAALGLLLLANLVTWALLNSPRTTNLAAPAQTISTPAPLPAHSSYPSPAPSITVTAELTTPPLRSNWTAWLALGWLLGALLMLVRASVKVAGAEQLRRSCRPLADETTSRLVQETSRALGLARKIRVAVTDQLTSPAVVGVLVPTLILPLSLFTTLTPEQIRFVLLHELAHIRRGDYLANLFQLFAEALWFFNPAVWWISQQIRREREACCDALAIELSGAPADYATTLVQVAEKILQPPPAAAPAFGDAGREPSSLADRVQRLLIPGYRPALRLTWRAMITALLIGSGLLFLSALGTRVTVAAILSPRERIERIEKKMTEYGGDLRSESTDAEATNAPLVEISGRVRTADGSPLPKIKWVSLYYSRKNSSGAHDAGLKTNGTFSTKLRVGGRFAIVVTTKASTTVLGPIPIESTNAIPNLDLVLDPGFALPVEVLDAETRAPLPDALIKAQFGVPNMGLGFDTARELVTDPMGRAMLSNCSTSVKLSLSVNAPGYEIADTEFSQLKVQEPIRISLKRGQPCNGIVLGRDSGRPLPGATVQLIYETGPNQRHYQWTDTARKLATTDAAGRFTVTQLRRGTKYWLGVSAPGHESQLLGPVMTGASDLTVRLGPELIVRGRVLGALDGLQIINQKPCLSRNYSETFDNHSYGNHEWIPLQVAEDMVTFEFTNRIPGVVRLSDRQGFEEEREITAPVDDWVIDLNQIRKSAAATPQPQREVIFRFTHASGVLPRGTVSISIPDNMDTRHRTAHDETREITNGEVRVNIPIGGQTQAETRHTVGYWFKETAYFEVTNGPGPLVVEVPCLAAGAIYAKARNADDSPAGGLFFGIQEIQRAPGRAEGQSLGSNSDSRSDDEPRKWVSGPLPLGGTYLVYGWRGNSFCLSQPIKLTENNPDAEVELRFPAGQTITGRLLDSAGVPIRNADLSANFSLTNGHGFGLRAIVTDAAGEFRIENATPEMGAYSVIAEIPNCRAETFQLKPTARPQTIRLQPGRKLGGRVVESATGDIIPNAEVRAADLSTYKLPMLTTRTDAAGYFEFTSLGDAEYKFFVADAQELRNEKFRSDGRTNLTLNVKLYEWSKLKPKPATTNAPGEAKVSPNSGPRAALEISGGAVTGAINASVTTVTNGGRGKYGGQELTAGIEINNQASETFPTQHNGLLVSTNGFYPGDEFLLATSNAAALKNAAPLYTREFDVPAEFLQQRAITNPSAQNIRQWFQPLGIDLDPAVGKGIFYKDRKKILLVRATKEELDIIEAKFGYMIAKAAQTMDASANSATAPALVTRPLAAAPLLTSRNFQVVPAKIVEAIETAAPQFKPVASTNVTEGLRALLETTGVKLTPPKSIYYNDRSGGLFVRATPAELDAIENYLNVLGRQPPQVNLKVRWVELTPDFDPAVLAGATNRPARSGLPHTNSTALLTPPQLTELLRRIKARAGVSLLNEGQVTTLTERRAQLQAAELKTVVTSINPQALTKPGVAATNLLTGSNTPLGPVIDILPVVAPDQSAVTLQVQARITEFLGYDTPAQRVTVYVDGKKKTTTNPKPRYRMHQLTNTVTVADGQTVWLGRPLVMEITKDRTNDFTNTDITATRTNALAVLITATIIDPAGHPANQDPGLPSRLIYGPNP